MAVRLTWPARSPDSGHASSACAPCRAEPARTTRTRSAARVLPATASPRPRPRTASGPRSGSQARSSDSRTTIICVVSSPEQATGTSLTGSRPLSDRSARSAIDSTRDSPALAAGTCEVGSGGFTGSGAGGGGGGGGAADSENSTGAVATPGRMTTSFSSVMNASFDARIR